MVGLGKKAGARALHAGCPGRYVCCLDATAHRKIFVVITDFTNFFRGDQRALRPEN